MISLIYFIFILLILLFNKKSTIVLMLCGIQVVSLLCIFFTGKEYPINDLTRLFNVIYTLIILTLIILPWMNAGNVSYIVVGNEKKVNKLSRIIIYLSIVPFFLFLVISILVNIYVDDVNSFKYVEGVSTEFYYSLPINIKLLILSNYIYFVSYFLIPLHFYYLIKGKYWFSFLCFIFSLNIIFHGTTFFSRSVFINYILVYLAVLVILFKAFSEKIKQFIKYSSLLIGISFISYVSYISNKRFEDDKLYEENIPSDALIDNAVYFSYLDYASQWYFNSLDVLDDYKFSGFNGQISFQPLLSILSQYGLINYNSKDYTILRQNLWPDHWWTFNGFVAYSVYDYGYIITLVLCFLYYNLVKKKFLFRGSITLFNLFVVVLLIQIPLLSIFYSSVSSLIFPSFYLIPIYFYLKYKY